MVGVTMKVWPQDCLSRAEDKCCGPQAVADARGVAHALGIPHYVVDEAAEFEKVVIDYFSSEYRQGRTPNPCVMCNEKLKFGRLQQKALALGATHVATGHYAQVVHTPHGSVLKRSRDPAQGPVLLPLQPAPGAARPLPHAHRPPGEAGGPRHRAEARPARLRQGGQPGDLLRPRQRLRRVPQVPPRRRGVPPRRHLPPRRHPPGATTRGSSSTPSASARASPAARASRSTSSTSTPPPPASSWATTTTWSAPTA